MSKSPTTSFEPLVLDFLQQIEAWISHEVAERLAEVQGQAGGATDAAPVGVKRLPAPPPQPRTRPVRAEKVPARLLIEARRHSAHNRRIVEASPICGCFHCAQTFLYSEIVAWADNGETAVCPKCRTAAVIGSASGHRTDATFLEAMRVHWFS